MTSMLVPSIALQGQMPTGDWGSPPMTGWAKLVPELLVSDIAASTAFWCDRLGFVIAISDRSTCSAISSGRKAHN